ncbi:MAG: hypothetical protein K1X79_07645 [Oligoflexia bacterium]|nr:hypothetical protein [Oligoflexia bacterium]
MPLTSRLLVQLFLLLLAFAPVSLRAQEQPVSGMPSELQPWVEWVRAGNPEWRCARSSGAPVCVWPGVVELALRQKSADLSLRVEVLKESWLPLPASELISPSAITVTNSTGAKLDSVVASEPQAVEIKLPEGSYIVQAHYAWDKLPPEFPIPAEYGYVNLKFLDGLATLHAKRSERGIAFEAATEAPATQSASLSVFRRLNDGSPVRLETRLRLQVSGRARPLDLGNVLPQHFTPVEISSPLPAFLSPDGKLAVQVVSGDFEISVLAVAQQPLSAIVASPLTAIWPKEEIWAWQPLPTFRSVEIINANTIQAETTGMPSEWLGAATYVIPKGQGITLKELRRGEQAPPPNEITLSRELWPNFDGSGFTVRDRLEGRFMQGERLNALPDTKLGRADQNGHQLLITSDPQSGLHGIELRETNLKMEAVSNLSGISSISAVGWDTSVNSLSILLHLPPLWRLIAVSGGSAPSSWFESWSLLHLFLGIVMVVVANLLLGRGVALLLGAALFLNHGEFMAPRMLFVHLLLLIAWRSFIEDKQSFWGQLCNNVLVVTLLAWSLQGLAFLKLQFTQALFPQLEAGTRYRTVLQHILSALEEHLMAWPVLLLLIVVAAVAIRYLRKASSALGFLGRLLVVGVCASIILPLSASLLAGISWLGGSSNYYSAYQGSSYDGMLEAPSSAPLRFKSYAGKIEAADLEQQTFTYQDKALASGPALPTWSWRHHQIQVPTPALPTHQISFVLFSPMLNQALSLLRSLIMILLLLAVPRKLGFRFSMPTPALGTAAAFLFLLPNAAWADFPRESLLKELQQRILSTHCQRERCASIERLNLNLSDERFRLEIDVNSEGKAAIALPGPLEVFPPSSVQLNGKDTAALRRVAAGMLEVQTPAGKSALVVEGKLGHADAFSVQFIDRPLSMSVNAPLWLVEGLQAGGVVTDSLRLTRRDKPGANTTVEQPEHGSSNLPLWLVVERQLMLHDQFRVITSVRRIGNTREPYHARIPMLPGEQVTSEQVSVENEQVLVSFAAGAESVQYMSSMPFQAELQLRASNTDRLSEEWRIQCSTVLACSYEGLTPTSSAMGVSRMLTWNPFPAEEVKLHATALSSVSGEHITVDSLTHELHWGTGIAEGVVTTALRLTEQSQFSLGLPAEAQLVKAQLDNGNAAYTVVGSQVSLLMSPGAHNLELRYRVPFSPGFKESTPALSINTVGHNVTTRILPSSDRWLLWTSSDGWGPSVLFWSKLLVVLFICLALHRAGLLNGSRVGAGLLGIGLASLPMLWVGVPIIWLVLVHRSDLYAKLTKNANARLRAGILIVATVLGANFLYHIVEMGLVLEPPMLVVGNQSTSSKLQWLFDHTGTAIPQPWLISLPLWAWRAFAIVWATWLVLAFVTWLRASARAIKAAYTAE